MPREGSRCPKFRGPRCHRGVSGMSREAVNYTHSVLAPGPWLMVGGPGPWSLVSGPWSVVLAPGPWYMVLEVHPRHGFFTKRLHMGAMEASGPPSDAEFRHASF